MINNYKRWIIMPMKKNEFYSVKLKKKITIPAANQKKVSRMVKGNKRFFMVGTYKVKGVEYKAWKVLSKK